MIEVEVEALFVDVVKVVVWRYRRSGSSNNYSDGGGDASILIYDVVVVVVVVPNFLHLLTAFL